MKIKRKNRISLVIRGWGYSLFIAIVIAMTFRSAVAELNHVPTGSMKPTIVEGDRILVNKLAYDLKVPFTTIPLAVWDNPERGDIVVFPSPSDEKRLVKRVIGLPGDSIALRNNKLYINGKEAKYVFMDQKIIDQISSELKNNRFIYSEKIMGEEHPVMLTPSVPSLRSFGPLTVPDGHYFMMGDNRDNSADSRYFGFVERKHIIGRAVGVAFSLDSEEHYRPRWHRFFSKLL